MYILPFEKHILYICVLASSHRIYRLHHLVLFVLHLHRRWRWWIIMSAPRILSDLLGMQISNTIGGLIACPPLCLCSLSSFTETVVVQHDVLFVSLSRHFRSCYIAHILCWLEGWHELNYWSWLVGWLVEPPLRFCIHCTLALKGNLHNAHL